MKKLPESLNNRSFSVPRFEREVIWLNYLQLFHKKYWKFIILENSNKCLTITQDLMCKAEINNFHNWKSTLKLEVAESCSLPKNDFRPRRHRILLSNIRVFSLSFMNYSSFYSVKHLFSSVVIVVTTNTNNNNNNNNSDGWMIKYPRYKQNKRRRKNTYFFITLNADRCNLLSILMRSTKAYCRLLKITCSLNNRQHVQGVTYL